MPIVTDTQGTALRRNGVLITQLKSISLVGIGRALRDVTSLSDTVHKHKLNIPDVPELACEIWYDGDTAIHNTPMQDEANGATSTWIIDLEQGTSPEQHVELGACYVFGCEIGPFEVDGDLVLKFNLKPQQLPVGLYD
jgi:hypothetical protein